jgi:hypothetical protein
MNQNPRSRSRSVDRFDGMIELFVISPLVVPLLPPPLTLWPLALSPSLSFSFSRRAHQLACYFVLMDLPRLPPASSSGCAGARYAISPRQV